MSTGRSGRGCGFTELRQGSFVCMKRMSRISSVPFLFNCMHVVDVSDQSVMFGHVWASEQGGPRLFCCVRGALPRRFLALLSNI